MHAELKEGSVHLNPPLEPLRDLTEAGSRYMEEVRLTKRERQVFELIGKGKTTKEIAAILKLSTGTIGNHRKSICRKLNAHSTAELVCFAAFGRFVRVLP